MASREVPLPGCPERWWSRCSFRYSRNVKMWHWGMKLLEMGWWLNSMILVVFSSFNNSMVLRLWSFFFFLCSCHSELERLWCMHSWWALGSASLLQWLWYAWTSALAVAILLVCTVGWLQCNLCWCFSLSPLFLRFLLSDYFQLMYSKVLVKCCIQICACVHNT